MGDLQSKIFQRFFLNFPVLVLEMDVYPILVYLEILVPIISKTTYP
jgi:hypothetical protein